MTVKNTDPKSAVSKFEIGKVRKRTGRLIKYRRERITEAIFKALIASNKKSIEDNKRLAEELAVQVEKRLVKIFKGLDRYPSVEDIQDIVEAVLLENKLFKVVQNYVEYRQVRRFIREEKKSILNKSILSSIEKKFSLTAIQVLASRYLIRDSEGKIIEDLEHLFGRAAVVGVLPELVFDKKVSKRPRGKRYEVFGSRPAGIFDFKEEHSDRQVKEFVSKIEPKLKQVPEKIEDTHTGYRIGKYPLMYGHLHRLAALYDEAKLAGWVKISFNKLLDLLSEGYFDKYEKLVDEYYNMMINQEFLPNSPTLMNAGYRLGQLSACFVLDMEDDLLSILTTNTHVGIIFQSGGGVGINYGKLRPEGDIVASTSGVASGPLSFMEIVNTTTEVIKQGGKRRGANMGVLDVYHPDIEKFIVAKEDLNRFTNFNISVGFWEIFWDSLIQKSRMPLINPRTKERVRELDPADFINRLAISAHKSAEPGVIFFDKINKYNVLKDVLGNVRATNPCGEQPLYAYESCNLGSINLASCVRQDKEGNLVFNWRKYKKLIRLATRYLDNIIDINRYPLPIIRYRTRQTRKVGLGIMGLADLFYKLGIAYNSKEAYMMMNKLAEYLTYYSMEESVNLAAAKGAFPLFSKSDYAKGKLPVAGYYEVEKHNLDWKALLELIGEYGIRNSMTTTIAPTGSIAMIADTSTGLEPQFSLAYRKNVAIGNFFIVDKVFDEYLLYTRRQDAAKLREIVANNRGMLTGLEEYFDEQEKKRFITAQEIHWLDHLIAQATWQRWITASISKTINMHEDVTSTDVKHAYLLGHELGCKGLTVYREGSRMGVIQFKGEKQQVRLVPSDYAIKVVEGILNSSDGIYGARVDFRSELNDLLEAAIKGIKPTIEDQLELVSKAKEVPVEGDGPIKIPGVDVCPDCGGDLILEEGCKKCVQCGWSACTVS